jgi:hypothetical protein
MVTLIDLLITVIHLMLFGFYNGFISIYFSFLTMLLTSLGLITWLWNKKREGIATKNDITKCTYGDFLRSVIKVALPPIFLVSVHLVLFAGLQLIDVGLNAFCVSVTIRCGFAAQCIYPNEPATLAGFSTTADHARRLRPGRSGDFEWRDGASHLSSPRR